MIRNMPDCQIFFLTQVCRGPPQHEEVQLGLLYSILVDHKAAAKVRYVFNMYICKMSFVQECFI